MLIIRISEKGKGKILSKARFFFVLYATFLEFSHLYYINFNQ